MPQDSLRFLCNDAAKLFPFSTDNIPEYSEQILFYPSIPSYKLLPLYPAICVGELISQMQIFNTFFFSGIITDGSIRQRLAKRLFTLNPFTLPQFMKQRYTENKGFCHCKKALKRKSQTLCRSITVALFPKLVNAKSFMRISITTLLKSQLCSNWRIK